MSTEFRQKSKVGVAGNFINQIMANNATIPIVGKGATELQYSDRDVYEVIEVSDDLKTVKLEYLNAKHDPTKEGGMGHQNWIFEPTGQFMTVCWRRDKWRVKSETIRFTKKFAASAGSFALAKSLTPEQHAIIYPEGSCHPVGIIEGVTERATVYHPIKLVFGVKDYRYDWEF